LLLLDRGGRLQLVNDEARRLLALPDDALGRPIDGLGLPPTLGGALTGGEQRTDELHLTGDRILVVSQAPARWDGHILGTVVTLRDHTELRALTGELASMRGLAESLHAHAHEAANQLHTVISLIELGRPAEALRYAAAELDVAQRLTDRVVDAIGEPVLAALLLGKVAEATQRGVDLTIAEDVAVPAGAADPRDLVTIVGNLLDNALDAAQGAAGPRWVRFAANVAVDPHPPDDAQQLVLRVADSGPGLEPADVMRAFDRGWSTKSTDRLAGRGLGLALVAQAVHRYGGRVDVSRGHGAVFTVRIPMPVADEGPPALPPLAAGAAPATAIAGAR
jgi:two-component system, CitB family, sensor kinase